MWRFVLLLAVVAIGSYYAARILLEGWPRRRHRTPDVYQRPLGPDDDDDFLASLSKRPKGGDESA